MSKNINPHQRRVFEEGKLFPIQMPMTPMLLSMTHSRKRKASVMKSSETLKEVIIMPNPSNKLNRPMSKPTIMQHSRGFDRLTQRQRS